jgi:ABC-2 type transport system ATP-binding protein
MATAMTDMGGATDAGDERPEAAPTIDIKCVGLTKTFRDFWMRPRVRAVDGVDLEVRRGEVFGLLGPNGSGKSTTIKMLLGLLAPTAGRIAVLGRRPRDVQSKRHIGYLPEESYLYRFLSARETLDYFGRLFRLPSSMRRERIDMLLQMVGLDAVEHRPVGEFSKGMQRRVGLAQSLINDPQLLILDEPTSGMDPVGARQIKDLIAELAQRGKTILLCTHQLSDVEDLCDRVAIMFGGRVRAEGTCDELLASEDRTTIATEALTPDVVDEVRSVLARRGIRAVDVERPRRRLESLFLEIVEQARAEGVRTSGATSGGPIADFLTEPADPAAKAPGHEPPAGPAAPVDAALIDRLTHR